ncbi:MAG: hypothetical protein ACT4P2_03140 [Pseudomonadota bacterium]
MPNPVNSGLLGRLATAQFDRYRQLLDRNFLLVKADLAGRLEAQKREIATKYDGSAARTAEFEVQRLLNYRNAAADQLESVRRAIAKTLDVKVELSAMRSAALAGNAASFDNALANLNYLVGSSRTETTNLIGHLVDGSAGARTTTVDLGQFGAVFVKTQSLATDYLIANSDGENLIPNFGKRTLRIHGVDVATSSLTFVSRTGDTIVFQSGAETLTGSFTPGGLDIGSAWTYNNLAAGALRDQAVADVDAALRLVDKLERDLRTAEGSIDNGVKTLQTRREAADGDVVKILAGELSAQEAELKAAQTGFDLAVLRISILGKNQRALAQALIPPDPPFRKGLWQIVSDATIPPAR